MTVTQGAWLQLMVSAVFSGSCGNADSATRVARAVVGDTIVVHSPAPARDTAHLRLLGLVGEAEGPTEQMFTFITAIAPYNGRLFVADAMEGVREYDARGQFVRRVARMGKGPAEILGVRTMTTSQNGDLAIYDPGNRKVLVIAADHSITTWPIPPGKPRYQEDAVFYDRGNRLWVALGSMPDGATAGESAAFVSIGQHQAHDTIKVPREPYGECTTVADWQYAVGFWDDKRRPHLPRIEYTVNPGRDVVIGCPADYSFLVRRAGRTYMRVSRGWEPVTLTPRQRAFLTSYILNGPAPHTRPAYARMIATADGRIWVRPNQPLTSIPNKVGVDSWGSPSDGILDVFESTGEWRSVVVFPRELRYTGYPDGLNIVIRGDTIWGTVSDSLGVQYVGKYLVEWTRRPE